jgi:2-keto-4-pentenoate hydratase/2-oxohepta-3-ene-1,7-dioic acid hydratase in catechol pathway
VRFARFLHESKIGYGLVEGAGIEEISTTPFLAYEKTGQLFDLTEVKLLAPCLPSKIVAIGVNYKDHAAEMGRELPKTPMFFYKPSTAVIGPADEVVRPPGCEQLDYEGELAVVIGSVAKAVKGNRWREVVLGYTCAIDATARDWQNTDLQWGRAKGFDTSAPIGPWIQTELDPSDVRLVTRINGEVKQDSRTSQLVFDVGAIIEFVTSFVTLLPGDVIMTGTPSGIGTLEDGDRIEVEIDDIGLLEVSVKEGS